MRPDSRRLALVITALTLALAQQGAEAGLFKKKNKAPATVPSGEQLRTAEAAATELLDRARDAEAAGKEGAAMDGYKKIVTNYPYSKAAPTAQFRIAATFEKNRKFEKAFDAYQELITTYRQTPQFSEALDRQFSIAMQGRTQASKRFLGIKIHISAEDIVTMLKKVIASAPQGGHAAEAQFEIARIHEEEKEPDQAIAAYRKVVENYPHSALAADAQGKIGKTYMQKVEKGSRDSTNIAKAREAADETPLFGNMTPDPGMRGAIDDASAENSYSTGRFYQKKGNFKAAMIYYSDVLKHPGAPHYEEVRERVNEMSSRDPKVMDSVKNLALDTRSLAVPAAADIKGKADYFGPPGPAPKLAANVRRPMMRNGDYVPYSPLEPGDLPTTPGTGDPSLLDPNNGLPPPDRTMPPETTPPALEPPSLEPAPAVPAPEAKPAEKPAVPEKEQPKSN